MNTKYHIYGHGHTGIRCYKTFYMTENNNPIDYLFCQFKSIYVVLKWAIKLIDDCTKLNGPK